MRQQGMFSATLHTRTPSRRRRKARAQPVLQVMPYSSLHTYTPVPTIDDEQEIALLWFLAAFAFTSSFGD
mgnify:FL=1